MRNINNFLAIFYSSCSCRRLSPSSAFGSTHSATSSFRIILRTVLFLDILLFSIFKIFLYRKNCKLQISECDESFARKSSSIQSESLQHPKTLFRAASFQARKEQRNTLVSKWKNRAQPRKARKYQPQNECSRKNRSARPVSEEKR